LDVGDALRAGGGWANGAFCGSRARIAITARWNTHTYFGGRGRSEPRVRNFQ